MKKIILSLFAIVLNASYPKPSTFTAFKNYIVPQRPIQFEPLANHSSAEFYKNNIILKRRGLQYEYKEYYQGKAGGYLDKLEKKIFESEKKLSHNYAFFYHGSSSRNIHWQNIIKTVGKLPQVPLRVPEKKVYPTFD